jgi:hypothetical protein
MVTDQGVERRTGSGVGFAGLPRLVAQVADCSYHEREHSFSRWKGESEMDCRRWLVLVLLAALLLSPVGCASGERGTRSSGSLEDPAESVEVVEEYWPDGRLRLRKEVLRCTDGMLINHGAYTRWHDNGNREYEATYVRGELHGVATAWHKNGQKWSEQRYDHGVRHGTRHTWDQSGRLRSEEHYVKDEPDGTWTIWKADGSIKWQGHFDHGKPE